MRGTVPTGCPACPALQNDEVPLPARLRAMLLGGSAALLVATLAACAAPPASIRPDAVPAARHAALLTASGQVLDDARTATTTIVPRRSNGALVVFLHGWGQTRTGLLARRSQAAVSRALSARGYTVLAADAALKAWGDPTSVAEYRRAITQAQQQYALRDVFLMGESMGGLPTMQLARTVPAVRAVVAWYPVCDVRTMTAERFRASIDAAWSGRSRRPVSPVAVGSKPMLVWASAADTVVDARTNAAVCTAEARKAGAQVTYFHTSGEHGDPSNFAPRTVVDFFDRYRSAGA